MTAGPTPGDGTAPAERRLTIGKVLATRRGGGTRDERAAEIASACIALHVALVRAGLAR